MSIKNSLKNVAADLGDTHNEVQNDLLPWYDQQRDAITNYSDFFKGMVMDPTKRGYSPETVNAMRANATGAVAGQKRSTETDVRKQIAASGMGNTSMATHMARRMGNDAASQMRTANRDVDLEQAEAQRSDLWNATTAWGQGNQLQLANTQGKQGAYDLMGKLLSAKTAPLTGAHDVSFWGDWKDFTQGLNQLSEAANRGNPFSMGGGLGGGG
jgi:hypothetical protein